MKLNMTDCPKKIQNKKTYLPVATISYKYRKKNKTKGILFGIESCTLKSFILDESHDTTPSGLVQNEASCDIVVVPLAWDIKRIF